MARIMIIIGSVEARGGVLYYKLEAKMGVSMSMNMSTDMGMRVSVSGGSATCDLYLMIFKCPTPYLARYSLMSIGLALHHDDDDYD